MIHLREEPKDKEKHLQRQQPQKHNFQRNRSSWRNTAKLAEKVGYTEDDSGDTESEGEEVDDSAAYLCVSCGPDEEFEDVEQRVEEDICCAYLAAGADLDDPKVCTEISTNIDMALCAFYAREDALKRGVPVARRIHDFHPKSEFTPQERRSAVEKAASKSLCFGCKQPGHFKRNCPKFLARYATAAADRKKKDNKKLTYTTKRGTAKMAVSSSMPKYVEGE
eukprot:12414704-Karenia_brevis.AAC.1